MNTILADRLFSDPRLKRLARELGCPAKAVGVLSWLWHGTQNMGLAVAQECDILDVLPQGLRRPQNIVAALVRSGWLDIVDGGYRVIGNAEHTEKREGIAENAKRAAEIRWEKERARRMQLALLDASIPHALAMPSRPPALPPAPPEEEDLERGRVGDHVARAHEGSATRMAKGELTRLSSNHPDVQYFEARYRELFRGGPFSKQERARAAEVIRRCGEASVPWNAVLTAFADERWKFTNRSLDWLRDHLRELVNVLTTSAPADDPEPSDSASPEWEAWWHRQQARKR